MKKILPVFLLLELAMASLRALELSPHEISFMANTPVATKRYYFLDNGKRIGFRLDNKMSIFGDGESAHLRFEDLASATAKIARSQFPPALPFEGKTLDNYRAAARAFIDPKAAEVQVEEKPNAIPINQWTSYQFAFSYKLSGVAYRRNITFLNYSPREQFVFDVLAAAPDFQRIYTRSYNVLNSLSELPADDNGNGST